MISLLARAITMSTPLLYGSVSEVISERSGMMVTAIEAIFLIGAWGGFVGTYFSKSPLVGILTAIACGIAVAFVYAFICITLKQHQVVTGTALNIFVVGCCMYFQRILFGVPTTPLKIDPLRRISIPLLSKIPMIGEIFFHQNILTYIIYLVIPIAYFMLFHTSLGLAIRSAGENPEACDVAGIHVEKIRYLTVLLSGVMGGIAGAFYSVGFLGMFTANIINGRGWIAFGICFLGNWNPKGAAIGTLIFGLAEAVAIYMQSIGTAGNFPNELFIALPYILIIAFTVLRKQFNVPQQLGIPYRKEG